VQDFCKLRFVCDVEVPQPCHRMLKLENMAEFVQPLVNVAIFQTDLSFELVTALPEKSCRFLIRA